MIRFEQFFETSSEMMFVCDMAGLIQNVNSAWKEKLGFDKKDLVGKAFIDFVHPGDVAPTLTRFEQLMKLRKDTGFINRYRRVDGEYIYLEWDVHILPDLIVAQAKDITERELLRQRLEDNEKRLTLIFNSTGNMVFLGRKKDHIFVEVNKFAEEVIGLPRESLIGHSFYSDRIWDDPVARNQFIKQLFSEGSVKNFPATLHHHTLGPRKFLISGYTIEYMEEPHFVISASDYTDLYDKDQALRRSEKRLADLFENMEEGFVLAQVNTDQTDFRIVQTNRSFRLLTKIPEQLEITGKTWNELFPGGRVDMIAKFIEVAKTGVPVSFEARSTILNRWFRGRVYSPERNFVAILVEDVTDRVEEHELILLQKSELEKAALEKDKFFSILVHDLRSPFHGLVNLSAICKDDFDELTKEELRKISGQLFSGISGVYSQMNELLEWIMLQRGMMEFRRTTVDIYKTADHAVELLRGSFEGKRITLDIGSDPGLTVNGDQKNIESIFSNLIANAIKFTPRGGNIRISIEDEGNFIRTAVSDNGIGIPAGLQDSIFSTGSQSNRKGTEGESTSGLGLVLCKELVELHGGKLWFDSMEGKGTSFFFSLPKNLED